MLPKKERLTSFDFKGIRPRIIFRGDFLDIAVSPSKTISRFACVISKKKVKKAVDRNTIKRKIYHILQENKPKQPYFVVIYPKPNILISKKETIKEEISKGFATL